MEDRYLVGTCGPSFLEGRVPGDLLLVAVRQVPHESVALLRYSVLGHVDILLVTHGLGGRAQPRGATSLQFRQFIRAVSPLLDYLRFSSPPLPSTRWSGPSLTSLLSDINTR